MSTNCLIGKMYGDKVKAIYCHNDGYPSHTGEMLKEYYNNDSIIDKLINLGDISFLDKNIEPKEGQEHSFDHPAPGITIAYHRDRGEDLFIREYSGEDSFREELKGFGCNYLYLWKDGDWLIFDANDEDY